MPRLLDLLTAQFPDSSKRTLRQMVAHGRVMVDGQPIVRVEAEVATNVRVTVGPRGAEAPTDGEVDVLFEDDHLLIIDKPPGLLSVAPRDADKTSAWAAVRRYLAPAWREPFLVHRLDEAASGILVFAKDRAAQAAVTRLFARHDMDRIYVAIVAGRPRADTGSITSDLLESDKPPFKVRSVRPSDPPALRKQGEHASTHWRVIARGDTCTALRVRLDTGRKHQIRAHLSEHQMPVVGDRRYGGPAFRRLLLHASWLRCLHPVTGAPLVVQSPPPPIFRRTCPAMPRSLRLASEDPPPA